MYCLIFVSTPFCRDGAGHLVYVFIVLSGLASLVLSGMCLHVDLLTADYCPLFNERLSRVLYLDA